MGIQGQGYSSNLQRRRDEPSQDREQYSSIENSRSIGSPLDMGRNVKHFDVGNILQSQNLNESFKRDATVYYVYNNSLPMKTKKKAIRRPADSPERKMRQREGDKPAMDAMLKPVLMNKSSLDRSFLMQESGGNMQYKDTLKNSRPHTKSNVLRADAPNLDGARSRGCMSIAKHTTTTDRGIVQQEVIDKGSPRRPSPMVDTRRSDMGLREGPSLRSSLEGS